MQVFDPTQGFNAFTAGAQLGGSIRQRQTEAKLAPMVASGDYQGAAQYAASRGDLPSAELYRTQYGEQLKNMKAEELAAAQKRAETLARTAAGLRNVPYEQRRAQLQQQMPILQQMGLTPEQIAQFDPTDEGINAVLAQVTPLADLLKSPEYFAPTEIMTDAGPQLAQFSSSGGAPAMSGVTPYQKPEERWEPIDAPPGMPGYYERSTTTGQTRRVAAPPDAGVNVYTGDVGAGSRPIVDKPEKGFQRVYNPETNSYEDRPVPGANAAREREEDAFREYMKLQTSEFNYDNVTNEIDRAIGLAGPLTAGVGGALLRDLPMTSARTLNNAITMVKSNLGFDRLQQMREESKTGGALGAVTEKEIDLLQSTVQRLDQLTDPQELIRALGVVKEQYIKVQTLRQQMYAMKYGTTEPGQSRPTPAASTPVTSNDLPPGFEMVP